MELFEWHICGVAVGIWDFGHSSRVFFCYGLERILCINSVFWCHLRSERQQLNKQVRRLFHLGSIRSGKNKLVVKRQTESQDVVRGNFDSVKLLAQRGVISHAVRFSSIAVFRFAIGFRKPWQPRNSDRCLTEHAKFHCGVRKLDNPDKRHVAASEFTEYLQIMCWCTEKFDIRPLSDGRRV